MEGYTDTILLDCSRPASEEAKAENNTQLAQYTNKLGAGVKLNSGDKVSVHSGFVSELGCGADTIEFLGRDLKHEYTVNETNMIKFQLFWNLENYGNTQAQAPYGDLPPFGAHCVQYETEEKTYQLKDNEAHLSVSYYKNANGEGYFHLPRRFGFLPTGGGAEWDVATRDITKYKWADNLFSEGKKVASSQFDTYLNGRCMMNWNLPIYQNRNDITDYRFGAVPSTYETYPVPIQTTTKMFKKRNENQRYTIFVKQITYYGQKDPSGEFPPDVAMISSKAYGDMEDITNKSTSRDDFSLDIDTWHPRDPSCSEYIQYKDDVKITTEVGYSSPASLGQDITDQMNVRGDMEYLRGTSGGTYGQPNDLPAPFEKRDPTGLQQTDVSVSADTTMYKRFGCATPFTFNKPSYDAYWKNTKIPNTLLTTAGKSDYIALNWINSFQTIGVKRPELFTTGRNVVRTADLMSWGTLGHPGIPPNIGETPLSSWRNRLSCQMTNMVEYPDRFTGEIYTSWSWTENNILLLKEWFDAQGRDETLFGNTDASEHISADVADNQSLFKEVGSKPSNSRFIHMNPYQTTANDVTKTLGHDNYDEVGGTTPTANASFVNNSSAPLFIYYDETRDTATDGGETDNNQRYGLFMKRTIVKPAPWLDAGTYDVIALSTRYIGGISQLFFNKTGRPAHPHVAPLVSDAGYFLNGVVGGAIDYNVLIGSDTHFSAYGTDAICLYNGMLEGEANDAGAPGITYFADSGDGGVMKSSDAYIQSYYNRLCYIGAEDPTLNFDAQGSRFNFEALHTPEHTGNVFNAGDLNFTIDPDASDKVYFLNKRLRKVSFCPDMRPYPEYQTLDFAGTKKYLSVFNENLHAWTIFDADSGVFIEDFNCPENKFANSLFGILGFTYSQFNKKNKTYNRQFRVNDITNTTEKMGAITTNSNVDAQDLRGFRANMWGAEFFNNQLPMMMANDGGSANEKYPFCPLVSKTQISAQIEASQLPTKMLSPYYVIRSNIVGDYNYLGGPDGGQSLPSVYIVNKENGFGDFFFQSESQTEFTITKPFTLTSVKTSVHNPDFTFASVSPNTSIIYKITKTNTTPLNIAEQVLKDAKKSKM